VEDGAAVERGVEDGAVDVELDPHALRHCLHAASSMKHALNLQGKES